MMGCVYVCVYQETEGELMGCVCVYQETEGE